MFSPGIWTSRLCSVQDDVIFHMEVHFPNIVYEKPVLLHRFRKQPSLESKDPCANNLGLFLGFLFHPIGCQPIQLSSNYRDFVTALTSGYASPPGMNPILLRARQWSILQTPPHPDHRPYCQCVVLFQWQEARHLHGSYWSCVVCGCWLGHYTSSRDNSCCLWDCETGKASVSTQDQLLCPSLLHWLSGRHHHVLHRHTDGIPMFCKLLWSMGPKSDEQQWALHEDTQQWFQDHHAVWGPLGMRMRIVAGHEIG